MPRNKNRNQDYKSDLLADLRGSAEFAAEYLTAARADSREAFLVALRDVTKARMGFSKAAAGANVNRETLYRTFSKVGNPTLATLDSVVDGLGFKIEFAAKENEEPAPQLQGVMVFVTSAMPVFGTTFSEGTFDVITTGAGFDSFLTLQTGLSSEQSNWQYIQNFQNPPLAGLAENTITGLVESPALAAA